MIGKDSKKLTCLGTQAIWLNSARVSSLWGTLTKRSETLKSHKSVDVLHVHFVTIEVRIVRRRSIQRLLGIEPLRPTTLTRIDSGEKLFTKKIYCVDKGQLEELTGVRH
jgi:hypothetical protein